MQMWTSTGRIAETKSTFILGWILDCPKEENESRANQRSKGGNFEWVWGVNWKEFELNLKK